ncbi:YadA-like family protein [Pseudocitrobacter corydidari]
MNKIFKVIWNPATGSYSVASETAKSRGKKSGRSKLLMSVLFAGGLLSSEAFAGGLDGGKSSEEVAGETPLTDGWVAIGKGAVATAGPVGSGTASVAIGEYANAALGSTALGYKSNASGDRALALGQVSKATGSRAIAIGGTAEASGEFALALGNMANASAGYTMALGKDSQASNDYAIALGAQAKARGKYSLALGAGSNTTGDNSIALGTNSYASGAQSLAFGVAAHASETNAIAIGNASQAQALNAIALGQSSYAGAENVAAIGSGASATGINSVALGAGSVATEDNTVSVGDGTVNRKIVNMAAGTISQDSTDAINGSQLRAISQSVADRLGGGASVNATGIVNAPNYKLKNGTYSNVGDALTGLDNYTLQWSPLKEAYSAAHGSETTSKITNVKDGEISASSTDAVNGSQLQATNVDVAANAANITTLSSTVGAIDSTVSSHTTSINNLGDSISAIEDDALLWDPNAKAFSAVHGTNGDASKITNVLDGAVTASSSDAINGSQLHDLSSNVADYFGGNAAVDANGNFTGPTYSIDGTNYNNVGDALTAMNTSFSESMEDALLWDGTAFSAKHGTNGTASKITNVLDGAVTASSADAINGSQLYDLSSNIANYFGGNAAVDANGNFTGPTYSIDGTNYNNVGDALTAINTSFSESMEDALLWDGTAFSAKHGTNGTASKITNVLDGDVTTSSSDAINGSQLHDLSSNVANYFGGNAAVDANGNFTGPTYSIDGTNYNNVGDALTAMNTSFSESLEDALLWDPNANAFSAAHGTQTASKITNVLDGTVTASSADAINGSQLYDLSSNVANYFGGNAAVDANGNFTGPTYSIDGTDYTNIGDALAAIDSSMNISPGDALQWDTNTNTYSASHNGAASKITNVAAGTVDATSTDAVNGSQIYGISDSIADALGGGTTVNADGSISAPTYTIADADYNNVGDALNAIDSTLDDALLWDDNAGAFSAAHGNSATSKITNVADGLIEAGSTDAINGSQLFDTTMMIQQNSEIINQLAGNTSDTYIEENGAGINYVRTNDSGLAFNDASAVGIGATAVGYNSVASGNSSVAIGQDSSSTIDTGIALGSSSVSSRVILQGSRETSVTEAGVVMGYDTTDGELLGALSIGDDGKYRQIINVADGSEAHDAVTVRQLQNAIGSVSTTPTRYYHANSTAEDSLAVGEDSLAMGAKTVVNANAGIGIGLNTLVLADAINGIAIGTNARANHANSIAIGNGSQTTRGAQTGYTAYNMDAPQNSVGEFSVGSEDGQRQITNVAAGSADTDAVNVGQLKVTDERVSQNTQNISYLNNQVSNLDTRVTDLENGMGDIITTGSTKYFKANSTGADANAQGADSVAMGSGSIAAADNSVALGTGSVANEANTVSVGSSTNQRRITNVAAGINDTDAVNVSQLKSSEAGSVRYDTKADGSIDYSNITLGGGNGGTTRISNVSAGVENNDAVNYAQLKQSVQETKQYTDQRMAQMDSKLSKTESKLSGGIASAMAMTGLPQAYSPGASMASIGGGSYNGESAVALGVSMVSDNGRWVYKLQGSTNSQGEYSAAIGAGIQW